MKYMLLVYMEERPVLEPGGCGDLVEGLVDKGQYVAGGILRPVACATTLRVREEKRLVTDGPFAETREQLAGYLLVEAKDLDEALSIAARHPAAQVGSIEVRPLWFIPDVPSGELVLQGEN
jgi:hypothetical protein